MDKGAQFSPCRRYRYKLWRVWDDSKGMCAFIGLNPSTADENKDDPTIRRCINYAKDWGYGGLYMLNIFAFRATDPKVMKAEVYPIGIDNDSAISEVSNQCSIVVAAWGVNGKHMRRGNRVKKNLEGKIHYLGLTKEGYPKHPLYLKKDLIPIPW